MAHDDEVMQINLERVTNPYYGRRYETRYDSVDPTALITDLNLRIGIPEPDLARAPTHALQSLMDATRSDHLLEADAARGFLEADESPRVAAFIAGKPGKRALLVGTASAERFLDFLLYAAPPTAELIAGGRSLRAVVKSIREMGGMDTAATRVPWLESAATLARQLSWPRLASRLIFVRTACAEELGPPARPSGAEHDDGRAAAQRWVAATTAITIEEGQHRAIAAAWLLTRNGSALDAPRGPDVAYLRGVNRLGYACGERFWEVHASHAEGAASCALALALGGLLWRAMRAWLRGGGRTK